MDGVSFMVDCGLEHKNTNLGWARLLSETVDVLLGFTGHLGPADVLVERGREFPEVPLEDEALALPALSPEFGVQGVSDGAFPVELDDPVVKDNALELGPLAKAPAALLVHEGVFDHLERGAFDEACRGAQVDGVVDVGSLKVCRRPQVD